MRMRVVDYLMEEVLRAGAEHVFSCRVPDACF